MPSVDETVFHVVLYRVGPEVEVTSEPRFVPSIWNWTPCMATSSVEEAEMVMVDEATEPGAGETSVAVGGVISRAALNVAIPDQF